MLFIYYYSIPKLSNEFCLCEAETREEAVRAILDLENVPNKQFVGENSEGAFMCDITDNEEVISKLLNNPHDIQMIVFKARLTFKLLINYNS